MAEPVYDEDRDKDLDSLTPDALRNLEDKYSTGHDEKEDRAIEGGANPDELERGGMGRKLRQRDEDKEAEKAVALNEELSAQAQRAKDEDSFALNRKHDGQVGRGYRKAKPSMLGNLAGGNRRRLFASAAVIALITISVSLFGFLNVFKLDGMMSNIDVRTFTRFNAAANGRSDRWIQAYLRLRLTQLSGDGVVNADGESEYFRANRVDTNSPIRDWYHTLRTSNFESDLAAQGIVFANQETTGANGKGHIHFVTLEVDGRQIAGLSPGDVRSGKLVDWLNEASPNKDILNKINIDLSEPGGSKKARAAIKSTTRDLNVIKRRQVRKAIQNETGVRSWRFFETTRDKVNNTKIDIRNKIINAAIPDSTKSGKFIKCLFGVSDCAFSQDPVDPENRAESSLTELAAKDGQPVKQLDSNGNPVKDPIKIDLQPAADSVTKITSSILEKANVVLSAANIVSTLDAFSNIDKSLRNGDLSKGVVVARGVQAMGLYQIFETARDQMKTGQVNPAEVNKFMQVLGPIASSEAWTKVVDGKGDPSKVTSTPASKAYCSEKHQALLANNPAESNKEFTYLCPDKQIGGGSNAASIEQGYKDTVGTVIGPILSAYNDGRHIPIVGTIVTAITSIINRVSSTITSAILNITGLSGPLDKLMAQVTERFVGFLGAGPILNGNESAGQMMNWAMQGGSYAAEASSRTNGASLTTPQSAMVASQLAAQYQKDSSGDTSAFNKIASLSNSNSLAFRGLFGLSQINLNNWSTYLSYGLRNIASIFTLPFTHHALAAGPDLNLYGAAKFSGINTYDFPSQCYNLDPITANPLDGTNIIQVMAKSGINIPPGDITWDLVDNNDNWYQYIYDKLKQSHVDNPDTVAEQIYNCNLLDTSVRGGFGYLYGYTADNGLDETTASITTSAPTSAAGTNIDTLSLYQDSQNVACAPNTKDLGIQDGYYDSQVVKIRICAVSNLPSTSDESNGKFGVSGADGKAVVNSRVSGAVYAMVDAAAKAGVTLTASSGFRTMAHQQALCPCDGVTIAEPGKSNHQMGIAIDFAGLPSTPGPIASSPVWNWLSQNATNYGYRNYPREAWHWSPSGN